MQSFVLTELCNSVFLAAEAVVGKPHIDSERQSSSTFEADENGLLQCIVGCVFIIEVGEK